MLDGIKKLQFRNRIKEVNKKTGFYLQIFLNKTINRFEKDLLDVPHYRNIRTIIRRERMKDEILPTVQENDDIPEKLRINLQNEKFLIFNSGHTSIDRILIFQSNFQKFYLEK